MRNKNYASPYLRLAAKFIDFLIALSVFLLLFLPIFTSTTTSGVFEETLFAFIFLIYFTVLLPFFYALLTANYGGSPGKIFLGLIVCDEKGKLLSLKMALFRTYIGYSVSGLFLGMGYFWIFIDEKRRGWHDIVSGSVVLRANSNAVGAGLIAAAILLILNILLFKNIAENYFQNRFLYQEIITGVNSEFESK